MKFEDLNEHSRYKEAEVYGQCCKCHKHFKFAEVREAITTQTCATKGSEPVIMSHNTRYYHHFCLFPNR